MPKTYYYLETDGQIFLTHHKKSWGFPTSKRDLPCPFTPLFMIPVGKDQVLFAKPILKYHPHHWFHKDEVIGRPDIDSLVQRAVNRTLPRAASKIVIIEKGKVLMVMANRGITKGVWNLPGGFIGYGEHPGPSAQREVQEEIGLKVKLIRLLGVYSEWFERTGGHMLCYVYLGKRLPSTLRLDPSEIDEVKWMPIREALRATQNPFARAGLKSYLSGERF
jgi:ADP-ribose pyrophosphatase YjhB (NUDIX family)